MQGWETKKLFEMLEPRMGAAQVSQLYMSYLLSDGHKRERIAENVQAIVGQKLGQLYKPTRNLPPPNKSHLPGEFRLADVEYPDGEFYSEVGLNEDELRRHILISGMTGTGKSTLACKLAAELHHNGVPFWVFDFKTGWSSMLPKMGVRDFTVYKIGMAGSLSFDPFEPPPGVPMDRWLDVLILVAQVGYYLADGSEYIINDALDEFQLNQKLTLELLQYYIKKKGRRGRESLWRAPVLRTMAKLTSKRCLANTLKCTTPKHHLKDLIGKNIIFQFDGVVHLNDRIFISALLLNYINEYMRAQPIRDELQMVCVIEDAHWLFNKAAEERMASQNIMDLLLDEARTFGIAMIVITLQPSKVSSSCKANTYCKIAFNLGSGADIQDISLSMFLDQSETKAIDLLGTGQFILKLKDRVHEPLFCTSKSD